VFPLGLWPGARRCAQKAPAGEMSGRRFLRVSARNRRKPLSDPEAGLQSLSRGGCGGRGFARIQESKPASGFLRAPPLPPGPVPRFAGWPPAGFVVIPLGAGRTVAKIQSALERFTVFQASTSGGGHDFAGRWDQAGPGGRLRELRLIDEVPDFRKISIQVGKKDRVVIGPGNDDQLLAGGAEQPV